MSATPSASSRPGVLVVGGSLGAAKTAVSLRDLGYREPVTILSAEHVLPYDKPPLSKQYLAGSAQQEDLMLLDEAWYAEHEITVALGQPATRLDLEARRVQAGDTYYAYDDLVIATGARARRLPGLPYLPGVHMLRSIVDARALRDELATARRAVVVGGGFIGFEVASTLRQRGLDVTVVEAAATPLGRSLDPASAAILMSHAQESAGVGVRCGVSLHGLVAGSDGRVCGVELSEGSRLAADLVVVGVGAQPEVDWLAGSGLSVSDAGLRCDPYGRCGPNVWAVGDVSAWGRLGSDQVQRHEHWTAVTEQARAVAHNIINGPERSPSAPEYVWSDQFGLRINIVGRPHEHDDLRFLSRDPKDLAVLYARGGELVGACIVGQPRLMAQCRTWLAKSLRVGEISEWSRADFPLTAARSQS